MSSRGTIPGFTQVLYDYIELYKCQRVWTRGQLTVYCKFSDICTVQNNQKALVYIRVFYTENSL
jgi:hypothetical protein